MKMLKIPPCGTGRNPTAVSIQCSFNVKYDSSTSNTDGWLPSLLKGAHPAKCLEIPVVTPCMVTPC